jgi:uncharacterized Zn-finger protein
VCNKTFTEQSNLKRHERIHNGKWPFCSDVCYKALHLKHELKKDVPVDSEMSSKS